MKERDRKGVNIRSSSLWFITKEDLSIESLPVRGVDGGATFHPLDAKQLLLYMSTM